MLWQEKTPGEDFVVPSAVLDLSFRITCPVLPVDHGAALFNSLHRALPWLTEEPLAAIHSIHGAASGNGWTRPDDSPNSLLQLPKRARLYLRLPRHRLDDARVLEQTNHDIDGYPMHIGPSSERPLVAERNVFCRSVAGFDSDTETRFTEQVVAALIDADIHATKLLCGLAHTVSEKTGCVRARSVMLADLELHESVWLQQHGLGSHRLLGCGIFLPHKSIAAVAGDPSQARQ